ncbi:alpha/beta hydrolase [Corynebacterium pygosceleis]|uniref:Alpha/beta hydrolase family protein n=1 Tax=Corynebacterium pygosceleis TaxID=2800406 RepID=A0A9Q4GKP2_9CORY|nr:alpha/beta hydrolase family protein [Corynebacterium pygosceleis]MCK7637245.1 esterase family protein [Corynebacterium pygosceleis]MCL0119979.1 esterase family protein [Corynebacterium pygosceleis]MCX7445148.1 alpha/beta hydrolase family protein [Corynebacterium pygosceleis]MCX7468427.1 alpha/beta hydrolase family protein [Corynebacterium pygosceleis]
MSALHTRSAGNITGFSRFLPVVAAVVTALAVILTVTAPPAHAAGNRDWLRPGCEWDGHGHWIQKCWVPSPSNGRDMAVLVQPAAYGGNGGLYLLDGLEAPRDSNDWVRTDVMNQFLGDNVTIVMPVGGRGQFYADWAQAGQPLSSGYSSEIGQVPPLQWAQWETFLTAELPGWLQRHFGVSPHRNSIAGISMGALPTLTLASRHSDQFKQAIALSGFIDPAAATHIPMIAAVGSAGSSFGGGQVWELFGSSPAFSSNMNKLDPVANVGGLRNVDTIVYSGNGLKHPADGLPPAANVPLAILGEFLINLSSISFVTKARAQGVNVEHQQGDGLHTWAPWVRVMRDNHGRILGAVG